MVNGERNNRHGASVGFPGVPSSARDSSDEPASALSGLTPDMDIIAEAVRAGFVKRHEAMPLVSFQEAVLMALPDDEARGKLRPLPDRGEFDVRRVLGSDYFFC